MGDVADHQQSEQQRRQAQHRERQTGVHWSPAFSGSVQSAVFDERTRFVRLHCDADCHVVFGTDPTATTNHMPLLADSTEYFGVVISGLKLAVIAA